MYKRIQQILLFIILINLFLFNFEIGSVSISTIALFISWLFYLMNLSKTGVKISNEYLLLLLFQLSFFAIALYHGLSRGDIFFLLTISLTSLYVGPLWNLIRYTKSLIKHIFLVLYALYILHFVVNFEFGSREFSSFVFEIINGFSYAILYFSAILITLLPNKGKLFVLILSLFIISLTLSRGPLVLLLLSALILLIYKRNFKLLFALIPSAFLLIILFDQIGLVDEFFLRIKSIFDTGINSSTNYRKSVFVDGIKHLPNHLWGTGYSSFTEFFWRYSDIRYTFDRTIPIDNSYILLIFTSGLFPMLIFFVLVYKLIKKGNVGLSISVFIFLGHMFFDDVIISPRFILLLNILIIVFLKQEHDNKPIPFAN